MTAVIHLATIQVGLGLPDAAGRTMDSLQDMREQLREFQLREQLDPLAAIWALSSTARAGLASGEVATANAYADAAVARLAESGQPDDPDAGYLAIDIDRLVSDCRWAAGHAEEAMTYLHAAKARYDDVVGGRLEEPARLSPALVERLAEPYFGLYRDMADRLAASGEVDLGLVIRRALVEQLRKLTGRLGDPARLQLASALTDLAGDLLAAERVDEADAAATEACAMALDWSGAGSIRLLAAVARARVLTRTRRSGEAVTLLRRVLPDQAGESPSAAHAVALLALAEAQGGEGDRDAIAATAAEDLARGVVSRGIQVVTWAPLSTTASYTVSQAPAAAENAVEGPSPEDERREMAAWLEAERVEAHRLELERRELARVEAERREAERVEADRAAAEQQAAERAQAEEAKRLEAERLAAAEEADRLERKRRREERLEEHRIEVERREAERLERERLAAGSADGEIEAGRPEAQEQDERRETAAWLATERAEARRLELERRELARVEAERREAERVEADRAAAEQQAAERAQAEEAKRLEAERQAAAEEADRLEWKRRREERLEEHRIEVERREAERLERERLAAGSADGEIEAGRPEALEQDALTQAQQVWRDAKVRGDRKAARVANERVVELLRARAQENLAQYGPPLHDALVELSSARLRSGDVWGSRAPAKEAKALAKAIGS